MTIARCGEREMPRIDGSCLAVGASPPPAAPSCTDGALALPGEATCRPIDVCPEDPFRPAPSTEARYVDGAADPGLADGSRDQPFPTIQRALDSAPSNTTVLVTDGRYVEDLIVTKPVRIVGRCAAPTIAGTGTYALDVSNDLDLQGVSVTGASVGIGVVKGKISLVNVRVHDTGDRGIDLEDFAGPAELTLRGSVVERARDIGIFASGATLTLEGSVVRGTRKPLLGTTTFGQGIQARGGEKSFAPSTLTIKKSIVEDNVVFGVLVVDSNATIEDSIVRNTAKNPASPAAGLTVHKQAGKVRRSLALVRSLFEGHEGVGVDIADSTATLEDVTVRAVSGDEATGVLFERSDVTVKRLTVENIVGHGVTLRGAKVTMTSAIVRNITVTPADRNGVGIVADVGSAGRSELQLAEVLIERAHVAGLMVFGSTVDARDLAVRDTRATSAGTLGDGITVVTRAFENGRFEVGKLSLDGAILDGNARGGLVVFGGNARVSNTVMCNGINLDVERVIGEYAGALVEHDYVLEDGGENLCGCAAPITCAAQSTGLKPVAR